MLTGSSGDQVSFNTTVGGGERLSNKFYCLQEVVGGSGAHLEKIVWVLKISNFFFSKAFNHPRCQCP